MDAQSFSKAFETWYEPLCLYALKYVRDKETAEDMVQDVFTQLWGSRNNISIKKNIQHYLFSSTRYACLAHFRKKELDEKVLPDPAGEPQWPEDPEKEMEDIRLKLKIRNAIDQLPEKTRELFLLHKIEGLSYKEISSFKGISVKTTEKQISRAYRLLREYLK